jgi:hypothetical protein
MCFTGVVGRSFLIGVGGPDRSTGGHAARRARPLVQELDELLSIVSDHVERREQQTRLRRSHDPRLVLPMKRNDERTLRSSGARDRDGGTLRRNERRSHDSSAEKLPSAEPDAHDETTCLPTCDSGSANASIV